MPEFINLKLMSHPINWLIVWVTVLIATTTYTYIHDGISNAGQTIIPD